MHGMAFVCPSPLPTYRQCQSPRLPRRLSTQTGSSTHSARMSLATPLSATKLLPPVFFVLGGPGSGKGTQCKLLMKDFELDQICVGDLLRREAASGSELGMTVANMMLKGEIVPGEVTMELLRAELQQISGKCSGVLIDGFPRTLEQASDFEQMITHCQFVLYFHCDEEVMIERLIKRGETSGRSDDVIEVVRKRLRTFEEKTMPVVRHYREKGVLQEVDGTVGLPVEVYTRTREIFDGAVARI